MTATRQRGSKEYATSDFYLAAFLKAKGLKLVNTERDGRRTTFIFEDKDSRQALLREFYNDGVIEVNAFKNAIQDLKAVIYNW